MFKQSYCDYASSTLESNPPPKKKQTHANPLHISRVRTVRIFKTPVSLVCSMPKTGWNH